jgi:glycosyltransferase involved in cell wall biosynthesis
MPERFETESGDVAITVLLPAFNEEDAIGDAIAGLRSMFSQRAETWELIVVDDGSSDETGRRARDAYARVLRRAERGGYGAAVKAGLAAARGEWVALLDPDGSYPPAELPALLEFIPRYEQVNGARRSEQGTRRLLRSFAKQCIRKLAEWISGRRIPDLNTGMKVFRRETAMKYLWLLPDGFSCSTSLTLAFLCNGHPVMYVPIDYLPRCGISKFRPVHDTAQYAMTVLRMMTCFRPLRVFIPISAALAALAVAKGTYDWIRYPTGLAESEVILATGAVVVFALGLLADLIVLRSKEP